MIKYIVKFHKHHKGTSTAVRVDELVILDFGIYEMFLPNILKYVNQDDENEL